MSDPKQREHGAASDAPAPAAPNEPEAPIAGPGRPGGPPPSPAEAAREQASEAQPADEPHRHGELASDAQPGAGEDLRSGEPADAGAGTEGEPRADEATDQPDERSALARERDAYLGLAQRTQADFENYRKRMTREVAVTEARGVTRLARELLPALDNLGHALAAADAHGEEAPDHHLAEGIRLVYAELIAALGRVGIHAYSPRGEPFDPTEHEAMAQHPVPGAEPGTVVEVYQQGYRLDGTILRPARVVVAA